MRKVAFIMKVCICLKTKEFGGIYCHSNMLELLSRMNVKQRNHLNILEMRANQLIEAESANDSVHKYLEESDKPLSKFQAP